MKLEELYNITKDNQKFLELFSELKFLKLEKKVEIT